MDAPGDLDGRSDLLYGAYLSGMALGATGTGLHHKLCHVLGGTFNLVHADTHSVILPHAVAFNRQALPAEMGRLAEALGVARRRSGRSAVGPRRRQPRARRRWPTSACASDDLPGGGTARRRAEITVNPAPVDEAALAGILQRAYAGARP